MGDIMRQARDETDGKNGQEGRNEDRAERDRGREQKRTLQVQGMRVEVEDRFR